MRNCPKGSILITLGYRTAVAQGEGAVTKAPLEEATRR